MVVLTYLVPPEFDGMRLERFLKDQHHLSGTTIRSARRYEGGLTMDGAHIRTIDPIRAGAVVRVESGPDASSYASCSIPVPVAFENEDVIVFDKPPLMPCHPSRGHPYDTVANVFATHPSTAGLTFRCIGRLDANTSGLVAIAKHAHACYNLAQVCPKRYLAVVDGALPLGEHRVEGPIERRTYGTPIRCVRPDGKPAVTHFRTLLSGRYSLCELWLETGRTHQIRVHMRHIGHPLAGDELYDGNRTDITRHALHCHTMAIPTEQGMKQVFAPLPQDVQTLLAHCFSAEMVYTALQSVVY